MGRGNLADGLIDRLKTEDRLLREKEAEQAVLIAAIAVMADPPACHYDSKKQETLFAALEEAVTKYRELVREDG